MLDTVAGDHGACTILTAPAVDESRLAAEEGQNSPNLVDSRSRPGTQGHADVVHTEGRDLLAFAFCVTPFFAKIDHQLYALRVKFLKSDARRYSAAVQTFVYFAEIPDVSELW